MTPLAGILSAFLISAQPAPVVTQQIQATETATVIRIVDGDTVDVLLNRKKERVRIIGIDAPESVAPTRAIECYGPEASDYLKKILPMQSQVQLLPEPKDNRDRYGRLLRYIELEQVDVGAQMIQDGYAKSYRKFSHPRKRAYSSLENVASKNLLGLWSACLKNPL